MGEKVMHLNLKHAELIQKLSLTDCEIRNLWFRECRYLPPTEGIQRKRHSATINYGQHTGKTIQDTLKWERQPQFYRSFTQEMYKVMNSTWKIFRLLQAHVHLEVGNVSCTLKKKN